MKIKKFLLKFNIVLLCAALMAGFTEAAEPSRAGHAQNFQVYTEGSAALEPLPSFSPAEKKEYTLMVYMVGSNLESGMGKATEDIEEMKAAGADYSECNVILYTGGSTRWLGNVPAGKNSVIDLSAPEESQIAAQTDGNADMGSPETLAAFVNFVLSGYPSEHYGLIFWNHGGGPIYGYGADELFNGDSLTLDEMFRAMEQTPFSKSRRLDFVGFDACLMSNFECMCCWEKYADYYIASQEPEPGDGWNYSFLSCLGDAEDTLHVAENIINSFKEYYERTRSPQNNPAVTLSCTDLCGIKGVKVALDSFSDEVDRNMHEEGNYAVLQKARAGLISMGITEGSRDSAYQYDLVDMAELARSMETLGGDTAKALSEAVESCVKINYSNIGEGCGMSVYFPFMNKSMYSDYSQRYYASNPSRGYNSLINDISGYWLRDKSRSWELGTPVLNGGEYCLQLSQEQIDNSVKAVYTVYSGYSDYAFSPVLKNAAAEIDENGIIHVPADPELINIVSGGSTVTLPAEQLEKSSRSSVYRAYNTGLQGSDSINYLSLCLYENDIQPMSFILRRDRRSPELMIQEVRCVDKDQFRGGKSSMDTGNYNVLIMTAEGRYPQRNSCGVMEPWQLWNTSCSQSRISYMAIDDKISFSLNPASECGEDYFIQLELQDVDGEYYASELVEVKAENGPELYEEKSENGIIRYLLYPDHAELLSCSGSFTRLEPKAEIEGRVLTRICSSAFDAQDELEYVKLPEGVEQIESYAFLSNIKLREIVLPESLRVISDSAFFLCPELETVRLPEGLETIGIEAFKNCSSLKTLELPHSLVSLGEGFAADCRIESFGEDCSCPGFMVKDGAVFSADGLVLLACPLGNVTEYSVPEGTERIGSYCFRGSDIARVKLPESLKEIGNSAFQSCPELEFPELPRGLEKIGFYAFGTVYGQQIFSGDIQEPQIITIGPELKFIGSGAFDSCAARSFSVSGENSRFSARDGHLLNAAGDTLVALKLDGTPTAKLPEGLNCLDIDILSFTKDTCDYASPFTLYLTENSPEIRGDSTGKPLMISKPGAELMSAGEFLSEEKKEKEDFTESSMNTEAGLMRFRIYEDRAALCSYIGEDRELKLPEAVEGKPLSEICQQAFEDCTMLERVELPETLETLGAYAFSYCSRLKDIVIPGKVEKIEEHAFSNCSNLEEVIIQEGVRTVGYCAFSGCSSLRKLSLPDSLTAIEAGGFSADTRSGEEGAEILLIGKNLREIGMDAFKGLKVKGFEVSSENKEFSSVDGFLTTKSENILLACPSGAVGMVIIPQGTEVLVYGAFAGCYGVTEVCIPDSVKEIVNSFPIAATEPVMSYTVSLSGSSGSYAERFCAEEGIEFHAR